MAGLSVEGFLLPLTLFAFSMSVTPGPNNVMLTASGANYGFRRTLPHMLGVSLGFCSLIVVAAMGLGAVFTHYPGLQASLRVVGSGYLLYLAWRIAHAPPPSERAPGEGRPLRFHEAAAFQYVNPKAWVMAITAVGTFTLAGEGYAASAAAVAVVCTLVNLPSVSLWAGFGVAIARVLRTPAAWRTFNVAMGLLTASCVFLIAAR